MSLEEGYQHYKAGDFQKAAIIFHSLLEEDEKNAKVWNLLGTCLVKQEEYKSAKTCFENAIALDPENKIYIKNKLTTQTKIHQKVLDRISSVNKIEKNIQPTIYQPVNKRSGVRKKFAFFFIGILVFYLIVGIAGSYSIGSGSEFFEFLSGVGIIVQEKISNQILNNNGNTSSLTEEPLLRYGEYQMCDRCVTYHIIPQNQNKIQFVDITKEGTTITYLNQSQMFYPCEPRSGYITHRTIDQNTESSYEKYLIIKPKDHPEIFCIAIEELSTVIYYSAGKLICLQHKQEPFDIIDPTLIITESPNKIEMFN